MIVYYTIDLDMAVTSEILKQQLQKYVDDHDGYLHNLKIKSNSIGYEGKHTNTFMTIAVTVVRNVCLHSNLFIIVMIINFIFVY